MNRQQTKIFLTKILPRFLIIGVVIIGLIGIVVVRFWGEKVKKENDEWWSNPDNKSKIEEVLNKHSKNKSSNQNNPLYSIDSFSISFKQNLEYAGGNKITVDFNVKNLYDEIIESAEIILVLELAYKKGDFVLNSKYDRNEIKKGQFIPILNQYESSPYGSLLEIKEKYNLTKYFPGLSKTSIDTIDFYPNSFYSEPNFHSKINEDFQKNRNYVIFKNIIDNHSNIWLPNEEKKLRLNWEISDLMNDSIYRSIPKINLFKTKKAYAKIYLKASNSNGFSDYSELYSKDVTQDWNDNIVYTPENNESRLNSLSSQTNSQSVNKLMIPIISNWKINQQIHESSIDFYYTILMDDSEKSVISILSQKPHKYISGLKNLADYQNEKIVRNLKPTGIILKSTEIVEKEFKGTKALFEYFDGTYSSTGEKLKLIAINLIYKEFHYTISYVVNTETEKIIEAVELK